MLVWLGAFVVGCFVLNPDRLSHTPVWVVKVGGNDGNLRPWHYMYKGRRGRWGTPTTCVSVSVSVNESKVNSNAGSNGSTGGGGGWGVIPEELAVLAGLLAFKAPESTDDEANEGAPPTPEIRYNTLHLRSDITPYT